MTRSKRIYVLDTNVLMHDPTALFKFEEHDVFIPMMVLEELDNGKKGHSEASRNARQVSRFLNEIIEAHGSQDLEHMRFFEELMNRLSRAGIRVASRTSTFAFKGKNADVATIAILQHRAALEGQLVNVQLQTALNARIVIEQAKGIDHQGIRAGRGPFSGR